MCGGNYTRPKPKIKLRVFSLTHGESKFILARIDAESWEQVCSMYTWPVAAAFGIHKTFTIGVKR